jgi:hypothetical protein
MGHEVAMLLCRINSSFLGPNSWTGAPGYPPWCPESKVLVINSRKATADSSTHHPRTERRLGPRSLRMTPSLFIYQLLTSDVRVDTVWYEGAGSTDCGINAGEDARVPAGQEASATSMQLPNLAVPNLGVMVPEHPENAKARAIGGLSYFLLLLFRLPTRCRDWAG